MTSYVLGIDIGTSFTAAAIGRRRADGSMAYEPLELGTRRAAVPSVVYLAEDGGVVVGEQAERRAMDEPDRVVREFKRRIGDETPIIVGGLSVTAEDIFSVVAQWVVERAEAHEGCAPAVVAVSHPASWGEHRIGVIRTALAGVGLANVESVSEPEAAGLHYLDREKVETGETIAVYDLGGGTFDVALIRKEEDDAFQVIGRPAGIDRLGGADFDQRIFEHVKALAPAAFDGLEEDGPEAALALARVRRECTDAKEALSFDTETSVPLLLPGSHTRIRLVRPEFEQMVDEALRSTIDTLRLAIERAALEVSDVATVLLIGGSSRIPAVAQLVSAELELPVAVDADPKASISLGAAVAAARKLEPAAADTAGAFGTPPDEAADAPDGARAPASAPTAIRESARTSIGLRATVLAGIVAAVVAVLIPITPLAVGTQERPDEDDTGEPQGLTGVLFGDYAIGGLPLTLDGGSTAPPPDSEDDQSTPEDSDTDDPVSALSRPISSANGGTETAAAPSDSSGTADAPADSTTEPATTTDPTTDPATEPAPTTDPTTEPAPTTDPTTEPAPTTEPTTAPEPTTDPTESPAPTP
ncbi:Hsp70 family protein [Agromyces sp. H66]|uniref:Hsp70 family protein n=1 Tax=Agromyces sp. H66 TaxID=2529859 RepID=UPI001B7D8AC7|nr:Hsp70 family protein [Agromyces sp. H66]